MVSKEYRDSRSLVEISYVIYKAFIFFATYKTIPYFNCLPSSCLKQYWATSLLSFSLFSILVMSFNTKYTHPERVNQIASTIYTLSANSFLQSLFDRDSGSVEKRWEISLVNIFFFPLYHGRKKSISISRVRFTKRYITLFLYCQDRA